VVTTRGPWTLCGSPRATGTNDADGTVNYLTIQEVPQED